MEALRDDPIIRCMERTGYPPWMDYYEEEEEDEREPEHEDDEE